MPPDPTATARQLYDLFNAGDLDAVADCFGADAVIEPAPEDLDTEPQRGPEGLRAFAKLWGNELEAIQFEPLEFRENASKVFVRLRLSGRGRASGVEVDAEVFHLLELREGKVQRWRTFWDRGQALAAAGMSD